MSYVEDEQLTISQLMSLLAEELSKHGDAPVSVIDADTATTIKLKPHNVYFENCRVLIDVTYLDEEDEYKSDRHY